MRLRLNHVLLLIELLNRGARYTYVPVLTKELGKILNSSQQAISKNILELEEEGYIERRKKSKSFNIMVTEKGYEELTKLLIMLNNAINGIKEIEFQGIITKGMGEGAYYISLEGYRKQFIEKLGFDPYPGTLNIKVSNDYIYVKNLLKSYQNNIFIEGFSDGKRTYGWVKCYKAIINNIEGALLILERTHHDASILEAIAPVKILDNANLDYGSTITIKVILEPINRVS